MFNLLIYGFAGLVGGIAELWQLPAVLGMLAIIRNFLPKGGVR